MRVPIVVIVNHLLDLLGLLPVASEVGRALPASEPGEKP
jgi:hypothetical protein